MPAERIVGELAATRDAEARVRADVANAVDELNTLIRRHNLIVTTVALHVPLASFDGLMEIARRARA